jgi:hypothetical protein
MVELVRSGTMCMVGLVRSGTMCMLSQVSRWIAASIVLLTFELSPDDFMECFSDFF